MTQLKRKQRKMKRFVLGNIGKVPDQIVNVIENTKLEDIAMYPLTFRPPLEILWGNISKDNVCVVGDALHPMTPDIGRVGARRVEDGITLAKCLAEALLKKSRTDGFLSLQREEEEEYERIGNWTTQLCQREEMERLCIGDLGLCNGLHSETVKGR
ncbi:hypothetical protein Dimus_014063 [Dionaea muscipula]